MSAIEQKENELIARRDELKRKLAEMNSLQHQLEIVESGLAIIADLKPNLPGQFTLPLNSTTKQLLEMPSIAIGEALKEGMRALVQFTKSDVVRWVQKTYPALEFSVKSMQRPLKEMMDTGEAELLKLNQGSKSQAIYGIKAARKK